MALTNRVCFQTNLRDGLHCRVCGRGPRAKATYHSGFGYHHIVHQSQGGSDETDNIILLCSDCHVRYHQNRLTLPLLGDLELPATFPCHRCQAALDPDEVEMNCGWYRCDHCHQVTHLFEHCGFAQREP